MSDTGRVFLARKRKTPPQEPGWTHWEVTHWIGAYQLRQRPDWQVVAVRVPSVADQLTEFHDVFVPDGDHQQGVRATLVEEEYDELQEALDHHSENPSRETLSQVAKELADLVYVVYGTALVHNIDLDEAIRQVHLSNMSKLGPDGKPIRRVDGKVLKGPNYFEPNMESALPHMEQNVPGSPDPI